MKNLKKTLAVVLAFAMILSMGFSAFAYTDVAEGTKVAEAVGILSNLGIFTGFEDGTFKPNDTVTRAQMAAIICRTLGYEDQAQASTGSTIFNDVSASHWASGYINVAQSLQIVNGYGNGNFGPEDQVTYEQAIKMIVVALGYELDAQAKGGWSTGYLAVAAREGISKNSNGVVGAPAARGTIAVLVYNSLEVRLMDQKSWTPSGKDDAYGKLDETILSQYLDIRKVEGIVASTPFGDYAENGYTEDSEANLTFYDGAEYFEYDEGKLTAYDLADLTYDASLIADVNNFAGKKVVAYVGEEEDKETGNLMVYAIAEKQGANKVTVLSATQLVDDTYADKYYEEAGVIAYTEPGSSKVVTLDLESTGTVEGNAVYNTPVYGNFKEDGTISTTEDLAGKVSGGIITLISNDADSKIDVIMYTAYEEEAVVEAVTEEDGIVMFDLYKGDLADIDTEDEDVLSFVVKDGAVATVADIAANDTVSSIDVAEDGSFMLYYVSSKTVTGKVTGTNEDYAVIGGEEYEISPASGYANVDALLKKEGIFFLNVDGQIAHDEAAADKNYGLIIGAGVDGRKYFVEVVLADGTSATYELKDKLNYNGVKEEDETVNGYLDALMTNADLGWNTPNGSEVEDLVFNIKIKDGKVSELEAIDSEGSDNDEEFDEENMSYGNISFNDATVVISVETADGEEVKSSDVKVGKVADFFIDGEGEDFAITAYDYDNNDIAGLVVGKNFTTAIAQNGAALIFTGYSKTELLDEDAYAIKGFQDGKKVSYTILADDADDADLDVEALEAGDVLLLGAANADGVITDAELIFNGNVVADTADKEDEYYYFGALVEDPKPTASKFFLTGVSEELDDAKNAYSAENGVVMRNSARYTLVDFSESSKPEISKKSKGTGLFSRLDDYNYTVFVRYFEDALVEVIVYKTAE